MTKVFLESMTTAEVEAYRKAGGDCVMIPVGSCEQHGPHGPLATDTLITRELSRRVAERLGFLVAPVLPVGLSDQHLSWPGSLSLRPETICAVIEDMALCLFGQGFRRIILHYFHTKNKAPVDVSAWNIKKRHGDAVKVLVVNSFQSWKACSEKIFPDGCDPLWLAHGGEGETSCVMALGVEVARGVIPGRSENTRFLELSRSAEAYSVVQNLGRYAPLGVWGEPALATARTGERIFAIVSEHLSGLIPGQWED